MNGSLFNRAEKAADENTFNIDITDLEIDFAQMEEQDFFSYFYHLSIPKSISETKETKEATQGQRRYFADTLICYECGQTGHINRNCPTRNISICILCARKGHNKSTCPMIICNNCYMCGHRTAQCKNKDNSKHIQCRRCRGAEHSIRDCPAVWREYIVEGFENKPLKYKACPWCFSTEHFLDDCRKRQKGKVSIFSSNFMSNIKLYKK
ncbi:hypothetical protein EDEG_01045 [Edhazardia aedis USNM 41457]|uniref:CCHC-type domain-containing protein n=1 Tax=Edhazardia aedis (strain USNM 41457) TaxID=1003232 RepID=J9DQC4_EDHAE|nr:hypothetical protein EDEG_01045 [Edhazardia aedis USNM 41457]|eukprot:EJW04755.1 hypothetical protein EDEG_01045 [Edhazardia aedis USNM 41457]